LLRLLPSNRPIRKRVSGRCDAYRAYKGLQGTVRYIVRTFDRGLRTLYLLVFLASVLTISLRAAYSCCRHRQFVFSLLQCFCFRFAASSTLLPPSLPPFLPLYFYCRHILTTAKILTLSSNEFIQYLETLLGGSLGQICCLLGVKNSITTVGSVLYIT
jgi:hypothetical protein